MELMSAVAVIRQYRDGDDRGWPEELRYLWTERRPHMLVLLDDVAVSGFYEPVVLGNDGRVWDGHHRIGVALALQLSLPVVVAPADEELRDFWGRTLTEHLAANRFHTPDNFHPRAPHQRYTHVRRVLHAALGLT